MLISWITQNIFQQKLGRLVGYKMQSVGLKKMQSVRLKKNKSLVQNRVGRDEKKSISFGDSLEVEVLWMYLVVYHTIIAA